MDLLSSLAHLLASYEQLLPGHLLGLEQGPKTGILSSRLFNFILQFAEPHLKEEELVDID